LNWNKWVRQTHRWLSIAFTVVVIVNIVAVAPKKYTASLGLLAVLPLALLLVTGMYLFVPYATKWRSERRSSCAFGDYQRDVVGLFMRAESSSLICNCCQQLRQG
jgi:hypothetical protein